MSVPEVELFTHPVCSGCQEALSALRPLAAEGRLTLQVTSLGSPRGARRAAEVGVSVVPTVRVGSDFRLLAGKEDLEAFLAELGAG